MKGSFLLLAFSIYFIQKSIQLYEESKENICHSDHKDLNIALHAQGNSKIDGRVLGSEITCLGFLQGFKERYSSYNVQILSPTNYSVINTYQWDIVFIEGWFPAIHSFIHEIRRLSNSKYLRIYYYCLDPFFPGMDTIKKLDVDGYFTNSFRAYSVLNSISPTEYMLLASDSCNSTSIRKEYMHNVVFVGTALGFYTKSFLGMFLRESIPFGLTIYGAAWDTIKEFSPYWKGVLPRDDILTLYRSSKVILAVTMDTQREYGMINNRVFEALSCGSFVISDHFPDLESVFEERLKYAKAPGDVTSILSEYFSRGVEQNMKNNIANKEFIRTKHTYGHRVEQIVSLYFSGLNNSSRSNRMRIGVVLHSETAKASLIDYTFIHASLIPALNKLNNMYEIEFITLKFLKALRMRNYLSTSWLKYSPIVTYMENFDSLWIVSNWNGETDIFCRNLYEEVTPILKSSAVESVIEGRYNKVLDPLHKKTYQITRLLEIKKALILLRPPLQDLPEDALFYDCIFYSMDWDHQHLHHLRTHVQHAFGVSLTYMKMHSSYYDNKVDEAVPIKQRVDYLTFGDFADNERLLYLYNLPGKKYILLPLSVTTGLKYSIDILVENGILVHPIDLSIPFPHSSISRLIHIINSSEVIYFPWSVEAGGEIFVCIAKLFNKTVQIHNDNKRLKYIYNFETNHWNEDHYSEMLKLGVARMISLGRANATVQMSTPIKGAIYRNNIVSVHFNVFNFIIGREGIVCLLINRKISYCIHQPQLHFVIKVIDTLQLYDYEKNSSLNMSIALKSILHGDIFYESEAVAIKFRIPSESDLITTNSPDNISDTKGVQIQIDMKDYINRS